MREKNKTQTVAGKVEILTCLQVMKFIHIASEECIKTYIDKQMNDI